MTTKQNKNYVVIMPEQLNNPGKVVRFNSDERQISAQWLRRISPLVGYSSSIYREVEDYALEDPFDVDFAAWANYVRDIAVDFEGGVADSTFVLEHLGQARRRLWAPIVDRFCAAIREYQEFKAERPDASDVSQDSVRRLLLLIPIIANRSPRFHVDSTDGCFSVDVGVGNDRVMSVHVGGSGHVNFSYVGQKKRIYRLSGTAKFRDLEDYEEFNRVLRML